MTCSHVCDFTYIPLSPKIVSILRFNKKNIFFFGFVFGKMFGLLLHTDIQKAGRDSALVQLLLAFTPGKREGSERQTGGGNE